MERIYDDAKDKNVAAVIVYVKDVSSTLYAYKDAVKTEAFTSKELEDAFVKGCLVYMESDGEFAGWGKPTGFTQSTSDSAASIELHGSNSEGVVVVTIYATDPEIA